MRGQISNIGSATARAFNIGCYLLGKARHASVELLFLFKKKIISAAPPRAWAIIVWRSAGRGEIRK
jgi:hypothetical protein